MKLLIGLALALVLSNSVFAAPVNKFGTLSGCNVHARGITCSLSSTVASGTITLPRPSGSVPALQVSTALNGTIRIMDVSQSPLRISFQTADPRDALIGFSGVTVR